jgi:hypothetical protein
MLHIKSMRILKYASKEMYTLSLGKDRDDVSTCTFAKAKVHCPIGLMQKIIQNQ